MQPTMATVHVLLGNIALRKQDTPGALKEFQEYLKLDPNSPMAEGTRTMVKKIEKALTQADQKPKSTRMHLPDFDNGASEGAPEIH